MDQFFETFVQSAKTVDIDGGSGTITLHAAVPGKRFVVPYLFLQNLTGGSATTLRFRSGTTDLTGDIEFGVAGDRAWGSGDRGWWPGIPLFIGRKMNESFNVVTTSTPTLAGWFLIAFYDGERAQT